jgi:DNA-3-methyladenine glycosylase II
VTGEAAAAALAHLRSADPILAGLIDTVPAEQVLPARLPERSHYAALLRAIVGQQLSVAAAHSIHRRLLAQFDGRPPTPIEILDADPEVLRAAAGLSKGKVSYLRSLAEHIESGQLDLDHASTLPDEELIRELTAVKGIGEWSAHMFLMFQLGRPDVLAVGDLGVRRAVQIAWTLEDLPSPAELTAIAQPWQPYRTAACRVLWWWLENTRR